MIVSLQGAVPGIHSCTQLPNNAKYTIVQSTLAAKWTFRLNRYNGEITQYVGDNKGDHWWEPTARHYHGKEGRDEYKYPSYSLFLSGLAARHTFLIDNTTGNTWLLTSDNKNNIIWEPLYIDFFIEEDNKPTTFNREDMNKAIEKANNELTKEYPNFDLVKISEKLKEIHKADPKKADKLNNPQGWELLYLKYFNKKH